MNLRIFKTRHFGRWARKAGLPDDRLLAAVVEMRAGLIDADLGGHLYKKRVPLPGRGKRGSTRLLIATRLDRRWIFLFGYEKRDLENLDDKVLETLKGHAKDYLDFDEAGVDALVDAGSLEELHHAFKA